MWHEKVRHTFKEVVLEPDKEGLYWLKIYFKRLTESHLSTSWHGYTDDRDPIPFGQAYYDPEIKQDVLEIALIDKESAIKDLTFIKNFLNAFNVLAANDQHKLYGKINQILMKHFEPELMKPLPQL